jgi:hypothetical protein
MTKLRNKRVASIKSELVKKSRATALAAVQIFNNPNITFKRENYWHEIVSPLQENWQLSNQWILGEKPVVDDPIFGSISG